MEVQNPRYDPPSTLLPPSHYLPAVETEGMKGEKARESEGKGRKGRVGGRSNTQGGINNSGGEEKLWGRRQEYSRRTLQGERNVS